MNREKIVKAIWDEKIDYSGLINFASRGINPDLNGLIKAFEYGKQVGIECAKVDAIRIVRESC